MLVAVDGATAEGLDTVVELCRHEAYPCPAAKLELVVYETDVLREPDAQPRWSLNFNTGRGVDQVGRDPRSEPAHWFVLDLAFARRHGVALFGPPPAELIGRLQRVVVARAFDAQVAWYEQNEPGERAATAARRARHWSETGEFATKLDVSEDEANAS